MGLLVLIPGAPWFIHGRKAEGVFMLVGICSAYSLFPPFGCVLHIASILNGPH